MNLGDSSFDGRLSQVWWLDTLRHWSDRQQ